MPECQKYVVEGKFDMIILKEIGVNEQNIAVANGKEGVKRLFRRANEGCF